MTVYVLDTHPAVGLAGEELARCLGTMAGTSLLVRQGEQFNGKPAIYLGTAQALGEVASLPQVADPQWDDAYCLHSVGESLIIAGTNPRSVLMGAYQYLRELGAEWLWPGEDGEVLPQIDDIPLADFKITEKAANRHRGVCIEGAPALEHVTNMVEWLPRVGLNTYFLQFQIASHFWRRWYEHELNPTWEERRELNDEEYREMDEVVIKAIKDRGLLLHQVGHGWTAAAVNLPTNGWVPYREELPEHTTQLLAEVNGERRLWDSKKERGDVPINTELCYSNPEARRRIVQVVLDYAQAHPEVDMLHFWLSDAPNNHCECAGCRPMSPSDWYVMLLNEISPRLKEIAPDMKLVFLAYTNTLWPPEQLELDLSNDNLVYMFAPISRCYAHHLADPQCGADQPLQKPERNRLVMPKDNRVNAKLLELWEGVRPYDSFAFDYHFMWAWREDRMTARLADIIPLDIADYAHGKLGGLVNCCVQRIFYPNGWPFYLMAHSLWGKDLGPEDKRQYFARAYGEAAVTAQEFLEGFAEVTGSPIHGQSWWQAADIQRVERVLTWLNEQQESLEVGGRGASGPPQQRAWRLLLHYHRLVTHLWTALQAKLTGKTDEARAEIQRAEKFLQHTEHETAPALDTMLMLRYLGELRQAWQE